MPGNLLFGGGPAAQSGARRRESASPKDWIVLVVDDEEEVHSLTRMILGRMRYRGRGISIISAHSGAEGEEKLRTTPDVAVILLDVVMETDDAGLKLVKVIRETLHNAAVRIILRTGQPGQAPEESVILDYDINDYKEKTELTSQKLSTTVITALRSYADIKALILGRQGLEKVVRACSSLFRKHSLQLFAEGVLNQISGILDIGMGGIICVQNRGAARADDEPDMYVLAASGHYRDATNHDLRGHVDDAIADAVTSALRTKQSSFDSFKMTLYLSTPNAREVVVHFDSDRMLQETDRNLVELFSSNISVEFDNLMTHEQMRRANLAMAIAVAGAAERRAAEGHDHGLQVARLSEEIASSISRAGHWEAPNDPAFLAELGWSSILHDLGKMAIPPDVLLKPGPLTPVERAVIKGHSTVGAEILRTAERMAVGNPQLKMAIEIALHHHERFDGSGYPLGLSGRAIPMVARIVAVADVYDVMTSHTPYRDPWPAETAQAFIRDNAGSQFDPLVVDAFLDVMTRRSAVVVLEWTEDMSVGSAEMDRDHRQHIDLINQIAGWDAKADQVIQEGVLDELIDHLSGHFLREEAYMRSVGHSGLEEHRASHQTILGEVQAIRLRMAEGFISKVGDRLVTLLVPWIRNHILQEDKLYSTHGGDRP